MNSKLRVAALAALLAGGAPLVAWGAGMWSNWPVVGGSSYCSAYNGNSSAQGGITGQGAGNPICAQTVPQGPSATGEEMIPADVYGSNGGQPVISGLLPAASLGSATNRLLGGDFTTNLWAVPAAAYAAASPTTAAVTANRWFQISAGNVMTVTKQTGASDIPPAGTGLYASMRVNHPSGTASGSSCIYQYLDKNASAPLIGNNAVFSGWFYAPATWSAANSAISISVAYSTAADSATALTNTLTYGLSASGQGGGIANYTAATAGTSPNYPSGVLASGVETIPLSTTWTRYSVYAPIPTVLPGTTTAVTSVGVAICGTPVGSGGSTDYWEMGGLQLQAQPSTITAQLPSGVISPTAFQMRFPSDEARLEEAYQNTYLDGATTLLFAPGLAVTTAISWFEVQFPVVMRETPTYSAANTAEFGVLEANGTATTCGTSLALKSSSAQPSGAQLICTTSGTALVAGNNAPMVGANVSNGYITFSADP